jgi:ClpP class serine protease
MAEFPMLAQRLFNVPLMLVPEKAEMLCAALADRLGIAELVRVDDSSLRTAELRQNAREATLAPRPSMKLYSVRDGVATIPVTGTLVHKLGAIDPWSGMTGYDGLATKLAAARADPDVRGIVFDADTPGGETAGCFEFAKVIYQGSHRFGGKPVFWLANETSCSAGYALAAACDRIAIPEEGITASIGVWMMLVDFTKALDKKGVSVCIVRAGDRKARGMPVEGWDEKTVEKLQDRVDGTWRRFAELVAKFRGGLGVDDVLALEGDWLGAAEAMKARLVDAIASPADAYDALRRQVARA